MVSPPQPGEAVDRRLRRPDGLQERVALLAGEVAAQRLGGDGRDQGRLLRAPLEPHRGGGGPEIGVERGGALLELLRRGDLPAREGDQQRCIVREGAAELAEGALALAQPEVQGRLLHLPAEGVLGRRPHDHVAAPQRGGGLHPAQGPVLGELDAGLPHLVGGLLQLHELRFTVGSPVSRTMEQ